ncbi:hypothetical protein JOD55_000191 [Arcanobacterium pluranimalium]|uniref:hypothetical protein n=1 Tax=Arcanobacterium pluranimalium TaxID=108028 RepID=UPI00195DB261|nr:hypothetical protein [Arcanobacterium pluranimalium]MBM7824364.1 hypothetical protein [Arcanobacterium pluranimalium]
MGFLRTLTVAGIGYVLGARAGRERYEQIKTQASKVWNSASVQSGREKAKETASQTFHQASEAAAAKAKGAVQFASEMVKEKTAELKERSTDSDFQPEIKVEPIN